MRDRVIIPLTDCYWGRCTLKNTQMEQALEAICTRGCQYVNSLLDDSHSSNDCVELVSLNADQQAIVMHELQSVMSVYTLKGSCNS